MAKVGIGLPVYNGERFVAEALDSLLAQTFSDFRVVVCDNASTDNTAGICKEYARRDPRIRYVPVERNLGAAPNFNRCFSLADGEYFKWSAHDDRIEPTYLEQCVGILDRDPSVVLCHSDVSWIDEGGRFLREYASGLDRVGSPHPHRRFENLLLTDHFCFDVFGVIRREALKRTPLIGSYMGSDRNLLAELSLLGRFSKVPRALFLSRDHGDRSIRSMHPWARAAWFDKALADRVTLPFWRQFGEYAASIGRAPIPRNERLRCYSVLPRWMFRNRRRLWIDCKIGGKALAASAARRVKRG